jgi:glycosyltransferase involved in cell wall biosynthesis
MTPTPKALIFSGVRGDTRRYRALHLFQQLTLLGIPAHLTHLVDPQLPQMMEQADLIVVHRAAADRSLEKSLQAARNRGALLLADTDDLIFDPDAFQFIHNPEFRDPVRTQLYREEMLRHRRTLQLCQAALVSTEYLAGQVEKLGIPARLHRNAASLELWELGCKPEDKPAPTANRFVLGYASGSPTHNRDFALIQGPLQEFLSKHPQAELRLIGFLDLDNSWAPFAGRIRRDPLRPWRELPAWLADLDLNLAPLEGDNPFSLSKSEIKWLEAALVSVPTLASRTPAFESAIHPGENGWLATSQSEWAEALEQSLEVGLRSRLADQAYQDAWYEYRAEVRASQLLQTLQELSQSLEVELEFPPFNFGLDPAALRAAALTPQMEQFPSRLQEGWYHLRKRGPWTLARQVWAFGLREIRRRGKQP